MAERILDKTTPAVQFSPEARSKGEKTRGRILDTAYLAIVQKGFAATSIDELVEAAGITKSGFFYHFRDKNDLARQLLVRFLDEDNAILDEIAGRARALSEDPLQSFLIFLKLYAELLGEMRELHPGCLVAGIAYQDQMFDGAVRELNTQAVLAWRERFGSWLREIADVYPPRVAVDLDVVADGLSAAIEGAIIVSRALGDPAIMAQQVQLYREYLKLAFLPAAGR